MAVYGRSVSLLRQIQTILNEQLMGVDLFALRAETLGNQMQPVSTIAQNSGSPVTTATRWRDVLAAVSPSIIEFGLELQRVNTYLEERTSAIRLMSRVVWSLEAMVILLVSMTIGRMFKQSEGDNNDLAGLAASVGSVVAFTMVLLAVFGCWNTTVNEMYRKIVFMEMSPLLTVLRGYSNALCTKQIVVVMSAVSTGSNVAQALQAYAAGPLSANDTAMKEMGGPCSGSGSVAGQGASDAGCMAAIDPCQASKYTMAYMVPVIQAYCSAPLVEIVDALIDLQQNGVDRYEEASLWNNVNDGVDALRMMVEAAYDIADPARSLTRDTLLAAVRAQVLPVLRIPGIVLRGQFVPSSKILARDGASVDPAAAFAAGGGLLPLNHMNEDAAAHAPVARNGSMPQPQCTRTCLSSGQNGTAVFSYYDPGSQTCYASPKYVPLGEGFVFTGSQSAGTTPSSAGPPSGVLVVVRPTDFVADGKPASMPAPASSSASGKDAPYDARTDGPPKCATPAAITGLAQASANGGNPPLDGDFASFFAPKVPTDVTNVSTAPTASVRTTAGALYAYALNSPGAAAQTIAEQASDLAQRLYAIVKQFRFALDLDNVRPMIDAGLRDFYGPKLYDFGGVSGAIDGVLHRLRNLVKSGRIAAAPKYVTPDRLQAKLSALSGDDATDLVSAVQSLSDSATTHRDLFPAYRSLSAERTATIVSVLGGLILLIAFFSYSLVLYGAFRHHKAMDFEGFLMRLVVSLCVMVITLFVSETIALKASARIKHNQDVIDENGQMLVTTAGGSLTQLQSALTLLGRAPNSPTVVGSDAVTTRSSVVGLLAVSRDAIERFDACNSITIGQVGMPLPVAELALYGIIGGVFLVLAAVCVIRIAPGAKLSTIKSLRALRARLLRGDSSAVAEAQQAVICARPPVFIWQFFVWFGVLVLVAGTAWFALASTEVVDDYKNSLAAMGNRCA
jgi:hypothetical protein